MHSPFDADIDFSPVAYGPGPYQVGELRRATRASRGIVMLVHGGFWRARRSLDMTAPAAEALTSRGFDTWNIEYRRAGQGTWADTLSDVAAAFDHIEILADEHGLDPMRVFLFGHSAGGQLAAWCAGRETTSGVRVRGLVTAGAVLDLVAGAKEGTGDGAVADFLGGGPDDVFDRYESASPAHRVPTGIPTRCVHSAKDPRVPFWQSVRYVRIAREAGDDVALIAGRGCHTDAITVAHHDFELVARALGRLAANPA